MVGFPATGDRIGPYRVDAEIGRGGMGIVYRATQLALNRPVALKILDPRLAADRTFVERFSREATVLASLDSPHIIQIFDHGGPDGYLYLAMQYVAGGDLSGLLGRTGALPPREALQIFCQILDALSDAHARGIVHRDVKPSNVLLHPGGSEPFAYLCDFGIAQTADGGLTQPGVVAGSWAFMSPERHAGEPATPRSDLYSAACVLWAMLTSRNPYSGTDVQVAMSHLNAPVPQLPGSDPLIVSLNRLFWACLAKNPEDRPDSAAEVLGLARVPLSLSEGVAPLSVSKPDSGIFRPAHLTHPAAFGEDQASVAGVARDVAVASDAPPGTMADGSAPSSSTAVPAPRTKPPMRWLVGAGALIAAVLLVVGVAAASSGWFGRPNAGVPATPGSSGSPAGPSPDGTATAVSYECWNSVGVPDLAQCPKPTGKVGLKYVYLSLTDQWDSCKYVAYRATTDVYDCTIGSEGLIRYRYWKDSDEAAKHYKKEYAKGTSSPLSLDGNRIGTLYRLDKKSSGIYKLSGFWLDKHFSFSVESPTIAQREELLAQVRIRAYEQLTGRASGAVDVEGTLD